MNIVFNPSERPTLGVEIEVQVVDEAGALATDTAATKILAELGDSPGFKHELLECTVEVITDVCQTVNQVESDLRGKLDRLIEVADGLGYRIMCTGTHPFSAWTDQTVSPDPRYHRLIEDCQWTARRLLIFGIHTHVGLQSAEQTIAVGNSLATFIPHFLAFALPAAARPVSVDELPVLARAGFGARLDSLEGLRVPSDGGPPLLHGELGAVPTFHAHLDRSRNDSLDPRGVVGHSSPSWLRDARASHLRRDPDDGRAVRGRGIVAIARGVVGGALQQRPRVAGAPRLDDPRQQVAGGALGA